MNTSEKIFKGKVVIVTGSSAGIGAGIAIKLAKEGATGITLHGRQEAALKKVKEECEKAGNGKIKVHIVVGDITDEQIRERLIKETIEQFGRLDVLVNNAGVGMSFGPMSEAPIAEFDKVFNVNVRSLIVVTQLAIPHLIQSKGNVVNISSVAAMKQNPSVGYYHMSKIAVDHFTRCLAVEMGPKGVRVNSVNPGFIGETEILTRQDIPADFVKAATEKLVSAYPLRRAGTIEEVADLVSYIASDKAAFITGVSVLVDGGSALV